MVCRTASARFSEQWAAAVNDTVAAARELAR